MMSSKPSWATFNPDVAGTTKDIYAVQNLVDGQWTTAKTKMDVIHPLDKDAQPIFSIPDTQSSEIQPFVDSLRKVPKSGLHNPLKNPHRYVEYGEISRKVCTI
jgi:1-pyrroline-5-carboxylate dehydrogenase